MKVKKSGNDKDNIRVYGAARCHKTQYYLNYLKERQLPFTFLDVEKNEGYAKELRALYDSGKLNFPTIVLKDKRLRNPRDQELEKWLKKLLYF